jgi:hypothetical protein
MKLEDLKQIAVNIESAIKNDTLCIEKSDTWGQEFSGIIDEVPQNSISINKIYGQDICIFKKDVLNISGNVSDLKWFFMGHKDIEFHGDFITTTVFPDKETTEDTINCQIEGHLVNSLNEKVMATATWGSGSSLWIIDSDKYTDNIIDQSLISYFFSNNEIVEAALQIFSTI